ncbi:MAG TPA: Xaa-Pro peptidase family protein [Chlamydiales bacterium]|nr:Xaa-Pro peptidase family protein [Chlamydiales bacterium]
MDNSRIRRLIKEVSAPCLIDNLDELFYLTGMSVSRGRMFVSPAEAILFVDGRYFEKAKKEAPCPVQLWDEQKHLLDKQKQVGFDSATVSYDGYLALKKSYPHVEWAALPHPVRNLRAIKDVREIALLKKAANLTWLGYQKIVEGLKVGVTEESLALEFEIFCRKNGASGLSFPPIVAFGENSAYPHYRAGKTRLRENQIVLVDVGAIVDHYCGDMTRVFFFGKIDPELMRFEQIVKRVQKKAVDHVKPGVRVGDLDSLVREEFEKDNVKQLYIHSLGHGIGVETHEFPLVRIDSPDKDVILQAGMVITIEPGLYQPGLGGVRIEDTVLVTETGHENFFAHG